MSWNQQERISCWSLSSQLAPVVATSTSALAQECCYLGQAWIIVLALVKLEGEEVSRRGKSELEGKAACVVVRSRGAEHNQVLEAVLASPLEKAMKMTPKSPCQKGL